jgi:PAS domain S-box-containing protein
VLTPTDALVPSASRLAALRGTGLLDAPPEAAFDRLATLAVRVLRVPAAVISLSHGDRQFVASHPGADEPLARARQVLPEHSPWRHVAQSGAPIVAGDTRTHPLLRNDVTVQTLGLLAYAGVPLTTLDGVVLGSFCVVDTLPREWADEHVETLHSLASAAVTELELRTIARALAEQRARQSELLDHRAFNAAMLEHLSESIVACDATGTVTLYNRATREFHGMGEISPEGDPIGTSGELFEADGVTPIPQNNTPLQRALRGEVVLNREVVVVRGNKPPRTLLASGHQFFDSEGRLLGAVVASRDVTTQKVAERALRDSEERFRSVVESLGEGLCITDLDGVAVYANDRMQAITGYAPHEIIGKPAGDLLHDEDRALIKERRAQRQTGVAARYAIKGVHKDGSTIFAELSVVPYRDSTGAIVGSIILVTDAGERRRWETALMDAKEEAERANRAKSDFLSRASHELRTPLNSVIGFSGVLLKNRGGALTDSDLNYIERIRANGGHLLSLVNDILDLAKVEAGKLVVDLSAVSTSELVHDVVSTLEGRVLDKPVALHAFVPVGLSPIQTDAVKMRQVLVNLVGNAIKFTNEGGVTVRVHADHANQPTSITVDDTGCGIAEDELPGIFEAFEQAESARSSPEAGTGLGLSIAKSFCDLLGYGLRVESEKGKGTRFIIELV